MKNESREYAIEELRAALGELESGKGIARFVGGHGIMSRVFEFGWSDPRLEIDMRLPCERVLSSEETQREDTAKIGASIRLALLLLMMTGEGESVDVGDALRISVWASANANGYSISAKDGGVVDGGDDWTGLVRRLEAALPEGGDGLAVIWP